MIKKKKKSITAKTGSGTVKGFLVNHSQLALVRGKHELMHFYTIAKTKSKSYICETTHGVQTILNALAENTHMVFALEERNVPHHFV